MEKTQELISILNRSGEIAEGFRHQNIEPEHIITSSLSTPSVLKVLKSCNVDLGKLASSLDDELHKYTSVGRVYAAVSISSRAVSFIQSAEVEARNLNDEEVSIEHILLAGTQEVKLQKIFEASGVTRNSLLESINKLHNTGELNRSEALESFTQDLTKLASEGKLDPVIGRNEEIRRVLILKRLLLKD